jgi:hypothetical protein
VGVELNHRPLGYGPKIFSTFNNLQDASELSPPEFAHRGEKNQVPYAQLGSAQTLNLYDSMMNNLDSESDPTAHMTLSGGSLKRLCRSIGTVSSIKAGGSALVQRRKLP